MNELDVKNEQHIRKSGGISFKHFPNVLKAPVLNWATSRRAFVLTRRLTLHKIAFRRPEEGTGKWAMKAPLNKSCRNHDVPLSISSHWNIARWKKRKLLSAFEIANIHVIRLSLLTSGINSNSQWLFAFVFLAASVGISCERCWFSEGEVVITVWGSEPHFTYKLSWFEVFFTSKQFLCVMIEAVPLELSHFSWTIRSYLDENPWDNIREIKGSIAFSVRCKKSNDETFAITRELNARKGDSRRQRPRAECGGKRGISIWWDYW
jgi:hypothetical protein